MQIMNILDSYNEGNSLLSISKETGFSVRKIRNILIDNGVKTRNHSEASYIKANPSGDPFKILDKLTPEEDHLKAMALGLYLTQGNIKHKHSIKFSNSNPGIVKIFVKFMKVICGVPCKKIKASLIAYPDVDIEEIKQYWANFLDLPLAQFSKTTILKERKQDSFKKHSEVGTATIYVHNSKLLSIIKEWVKEYSYVAQIVEH